MANLIACSICGAPDQEAGKYCEHCGSQVQANDGSHSASPAVTPDASVDDIIAVAPPTAMMPSAADVGDIIADSLPAPDGTSGPTAPTMRFVRIDNGVQKPEHSFDVPVGSRLLVGRMDPVNGVFPEVDVTRWAARVKTPDGLLYTVHRKQCYISRDNDGRVWISDYHSYVGDTMVSPAGTSQYHLIPALTEKRESNHEGAVALEVGDRILMGQGEGILIFVLIEE